MFAILVLASLLPTLPDLPAVLGSNGVSWTTPSHDSSGSMPIGNGRLGANVWVEENGDLVLLVSHTDAWSEAGRLLKLGRVRIAFTPPFDVAHGFDTSLLLYDACIKIHGGMHDDQLGIDVFVDPVTDVIHVAGQAWGPHRMTVTLDVWRKEPHRLRGDELNSSWTMHGAPDSVEVIESADVVRDDLTDALAVFHRNATSIVPFTLAHQGLNEVAAAFLDPILGRSSGLFVECAQLAKTSAIRLASRADVEQFDVRIAGLSEQPSGKASDEWLDHARKAASSSDGATARDRAAEAWRKISERSWIHVRGDPADPKSNVLSRVTQSWWLQRWMTYCAGRGDFPMKFNGSIFTVEPKATGGQPFDADWRKWGGDFWWQNTRLPYEGMLARGEAELMDPLFRFYERVRPGCIARAKLYHRVDGAYFPETMTCFGTYSNGDYGWQREGVARDVVQCPWWQWAWQQGLELVALMLDRYDANLDEPFARDHVVPMAYAVLGWFDGRFARDDKGVLVISPTQAVETYWKDVVNDMPTVAGLREVTTRLLALPASIGSESDRALWKRLSLAAPALPTRTVDGVQILAPAQHFDAQRSNCENPELYCVFPFRAYGIGRDGLETARETFRRRIDKSHVGWTPDGIDAARLGLVDEARDDLLARCANSNGAHRFPAMWGPNFDWLPDQDHGANLMTELQEMILQPVGDALHVLPAWPAEWDVDFKLNAPKNTVVEGVWRKGRFEKLEVQPIERRKDLVLHRGELPAAK